jgi:hypothetical protein
MIGVRIGNQDQIRLGSSFTACLAGRVDVNGRAANTNHQGRVMHGFDLDETAGWGELIAGALGTLGENGD